jgi:hypothetical protein
LIRVIDKNIEFCSRFENFRPIVEHRATWMGSLEATTGAWIVDSVYFHPDFRGVSESSTASRPPLQRHTPVANHDQPQPNSSWQEELVASMVFRLAEALWAGQKPDVADSPVDLGACRDAAFSDSVLLNEDRSPAFHVYFFSYSDTMIAIVY